MDVGGSIHPNSIVANVLLLGAASSHSSLRRRHSSASRQNIECRVESLSQKYVEGNTGIFYPDKNGPEAYTVHSDEPFLVPSIPRELPSYADDATDAAIYYANFAYEDEVTAFQTYDTLQQTLRQQILTSVEPIFYHELQDKEFGFADVTPLQLLDHLTSCYVEITLQDLEENREKLRAPWNPNEDMITVWNRIHDCILFAAGTYDPSYTTPQCF
ncbi:hypothetical protein IV203_011413 [Nitzschia inconspicua]|uniref:Uncharacterized protein n=1 Tax=Nitzschia inconspicua TaxID=303405 RepID=A0A9K3KSF8_9STRA|nr:hypothetical protein IV203_011413 [Nitzschia inconspicua]